MVRLSNGTAKTEVSLGKVMWDKHSCGAGARVAVGVDGEEVAASPLSVEALQVVLRLLAECRSTAVTPVTSHVHCRGRGSSLLNARCLYCVGLAMKSAKFVPMEGVYIGDLVGGLKEAGLKLP
jgi:hypothetical protein